MNAPQHDFSKFSFVKTVVLPALWIFLVPSIALAFFLHAQPQFIHGHAIDPALRGSAVTFRWMIWLAGGSIIAGLAICLLAGICILLSLRSQAAQYWSLVVGWQILRIYGALQVVAIGTLLTFMSFWVPALWFEIYFPKLTIVLGVFALFAVGIVIKAIFTTPHQENVVEGQVLSPRDAPALWRELHRLCAQIGTAPPDHVVAGIDDSFFVTERPTCVGEMEYSGRFLFVSLALLKEMSSSQAAAILAHEMAHFSGKDTYYSRKIGPLLERYDQYLEALVNSVLAIPVFYYMLCFRLLFELSLRTRQREREFRADRIAVANTSPRDFAAGLLHTVAYSRFRDSVQKELFEQERAMESADIAARIERGYRQFAASFLASPDIGDLESTHPFDTHPPLSERLKAVGVSLSAADTQSLLVGMTDAGWRRLIPRADELEQTQWRAFEQQFRDYHEATLAYRFLPTTDEERAIVEKAFPTVTFQGKKLKLDLDYRQVNLSDWKTPIRYSEITKVEMDDSGKLQIHFYQGKKRVQYIKVKSFPKPQRDELLAAFQSYYERYLVAVDYQKEKRQSQNLNEM